MPSAGTVGLPSSPRAVVEPGAGLVATTLRPAWPGPSSIEDIAVQVTDGRGQRRHCGPHAEAVVQLVPGQIQGPINGVLQHRARRGVAVFRGLEISSPGEHSLHFRLPEVLSAVTRAPVEGGRLTLWVERAEATAEAAAEPEFPEPVQRLRLSAPSGVVILGRPVSRPLRVELATLSGARVLHGPRSRARVRIETDPPLALSGHARPAVRGVATFAGLRVWGHAWASPSRQEPGLARTHPATAGIYGATYCFVAIVEAEGLRVGCGAPGVFTVNHPGGRPLLHPQPGLRLARQATCWAEIWLPRPAEESR